MFDFIFEIIIVTFGLGIGKIVLPIFTFGKCVALDSQVENRKSKTNKSSNKKWYGIKISNVYYLNAELTGTIGILTLLGIIILIASLL
ncbi:MAG: hypothetical protein CVV49_19735 [Spirochaetae bacterium HGW-Spirochaetae-5]|nr:MAG: hypothetical protein CVV49_19735 [Spirochaetae bacterium HGW-Spirochaetae-5]